MRSLATDGTDVYVGTDSVDIAGIPQADHVAKWNGTSWSALGANSSGANGWFPPTAFIYGLTVSGSRLYAGGAFSNANGDPVADNIAQFDGKTWGPVGSNGNGDGPLNGTVNDLATQSGLLYAGGNFVQTGGDRLLRFIASFPFAGAPPAATSPTTTTTTTTTTGAGPAAPIPPPTATTTGTVIVNGRPFVTGTIPFGVTVDVTRGAVVLRTSVGTLKVTGASGITAAFTLARGHRPGQAGRGASACEGRLQHVSQTQEEPHRGRHRDGRPPAMG